MLSRHGVGRKEASEVPVPGMGAATAPPPGTQQVARDSCTCSAELCSGGRAAGPRGVWPGAWQLVPACPRCDAAPGPSDEVCFVTPGPSRSLSEWRS